MDEKAEERWGNGRRREVIFFLIGGRNMGVIQVEYFKERSRDTTTE